MDKDKIMKNIEVTGYLTRGQLREEFSGSDQEVLDANLTYLATKNYIRKVEFQGPSGRETMYYRTPQ